MWRQDDNAAGRAPLSSRIRTSILDEEVAGSPPRRNAGGVAEELEEEVVTRVDTRVRAGDVSFLEGERHAAPTGPGARVSVNLFYTTRSDLFYGGVAINGNARAPVPDWLRRWRELRRRVAGDRHEVGGEQIEERSAGTTGKQRRWKKSSSGSGGPV